MLGYIMPRADLGPKNTKRDPHAVAISGADVTNASHECKKRDPYAVALSGTDLSKTRIGYLGSAYIAIKQRPKG